MIKYITVAKEKIKKDGLLVDGQTYKIHFTGLQLLIIEHDAGQTYQFVELRSAMLSVETISPTFLKVLLITLQLHQTTSPVVNDNKKDSSNEETSTGENVLGGRGLGVEFCVFCTAVRVTQNYYTETQVYSTIWH